MIQFEELRLKLLESEKPLTELAAALGLDEMAKEIETLEEQTAAEGFWEDLQNAQKVTQRIASLKNKITHRLNAFWDNNICKACTVSKIA